MAFGETRRRSSREAVEGPSHAADRRAASCSSTPTPQVVLDKAAAAELTRFKTPVAARAASKWDEPASTRKAVIWLAAAAEEADAEADRRGLQRARPAGPARQRAARRTTSTSTSSATCRRRSPAGPAASPTSDKRPGDIRPPHRRRSSPSACVIFSPAPRRRRHLAWAARSSASCEQGHEVHVAYQTSRQHRRLRRRRPPLRRFRPPSSTALLRHRRRRRPSRSRSTSRRFLRKKQPGQVDSPKLQQIKG